MAQPTPAGATPLVGRAGIMGSLTLVGLTQIDFDPPATGLGDFVIGVATDSFAGLLFTAGNIQDLDLSVTPVGVPVSVPNFMTFQADPVSSFELTAIVPGSFSSASCFDAPAVGQTCTPDGSLYEFVNNAAGTTVSFSVVGNAINGADSTPFTGIFTAQIAGTNYQSILGTLGNDGAVQATFSADFLAVPEPGTAMLVAAGALVGAVRARRRVRTA
jgi:hypothetical protein